jgi:hypothetical protein
MRHRPTLTYRADFDRLEPRSMLSAGTVLQPSITLLDPTPVQDLVQAGPRPDLLASRQMNDRDLARSSFFVARLNERVKPKFYDIITLLNASGKTLERKDVGLVIINNKAYDFPLRRFTPDLGYQFRITPSGSVVPG